jgi:hypothetical protein
VSSSNKRNEGVKIILRGDPGSPLHPISANLNYKSEIRNKSEKKKMPGKKKVKREKGAR